MTLRLWRLCEIMRHYNVWQLAHAIEFLLEMQAQGMLASVTPSQGENAAVPDVHMNNIYVPGLKYVQAQCEYLELRSALARMPHFNREIRQGITWSELRNQAQVLHEAIHAELCYRRFAFVTTEKSLLHDKFASHWDGIWKKFPEAKEDSQRAIDCYALEQNTACVFHLMRVAELGLREIARKVGVKLTDKGKQMAVEFATWDKVINAIKSKLTVAHSLSRGTRKSERLRFYSDAADQCTYFRDMWRNDVAHARKHYNDGEALGVMIRVREFMQLLSN